MIIKGSFSKVIYNAPKFEQIYKQNLSKRFHKSNQKYFLVLFSDHCPFIVIENIDNYFLACQI